MEPEPEEINDCPVEQVRLIVPITDDPTLPVLTFRTWALGISFCVFLAFVTNFYGFRASSPPITVTPVLLIVLPIGRLMAAVLPSKPMRVPATGWSFSLNPGPFNAKEHVLISIFASTASSTAFGLGVITQMKAFYHRELNLMAVILLTISSQVIGYGWAGIFKKFLVDSPHMWWPSTLAQVSLFRALHEKETRPKWGLTRVQFFLIVLITSFSFYVVPGYFFPSLTALSFVCWIWKDSVTAQQLGSGWLGFGLGSFSLDWSLMSISLTTPTFALVNTLVGLVFVNHILTGIAYWSNLYEAKRFPVFSTDLFDASGQPYNISRILDENNLQFNEQGYNNYGPIYLSIRYAVNWGMSFAAIPATLCHAFLFYGKSIWRETNEAFRDKSGDVHIRIMKRNYDAIPQWWFHILLVLMIPISILACEGFGKQFQLPYWGVLLACAIAFIYTFPVGVIQATSNVWPGGIQEVTQLLISYIYPGRPIANMVFKAYGYTSTAQGLAFLQDFKLGHYMKIPPRSMFIVQLVSTVISCSVNVGTTWWFLTNVDNICHPEKLPKGSPWICPGDDMIYSESILWGVAGARRIFGQLGLYSKLNFFFLVGLLAPVPAWAFSLLYPQKKWLRLIILPVILGAGGSMPPGRMAWWWTYLAVGFFFNFHVYRRFQGWWARHVYVLAAGSDAGIILLNLLAYFSVQAHGVYGVNWWGLAVNDHCHLAHCPTKPGIVVDGCPTH